jgi:hypothetical protein
MGTQDHPISALRSLDCIGYFQKRYPGCIDLFTDAHPEAIPHKSEAKHRITKKCGSRGLLKLMIEGAE